MRCGAYPYVSAPIEDRSTEVDEKEILRSQAEYFEKQLNQLRDKLDALDKKE